MKTEAEYQKFMKENEITEMQVGGVTHTLIPTAPKKKTISEQIKDLQQKLTEVKGRETEKYARIVGYYRAVKNWNIGKKSEWKDRVNYDEKSFYGREPIEHSLKDTPVTDETLVTGAFHHYKLLYRPTCPNCPAVEKVMETVDLPGTHINVEEEFELAVKLNVYAVPTVIFFDRVDIEIARASQIPDLKAIIAMFTGGT